jgi:hypothetical protein
VYVEGFDGGWVVCDEYWSVDVASGKVAFLFGLEGFAPCDGVFKGGGWGGGLENGDGVCVGEASPGVREIKALGCRGGRGQGGFDLVIRRRRKHRVRLRKRMPRPILLQASRILRGV